MPAFPRLPVALAAALLLVVGCGSDDDEGPEAEGGGAGGGGSAAVAVEDDFFDPEETEVVAGAQVVWTWEGNNPHNVSGDDFKSKIQTDGTFEHTFDEAGTFDYICTVHPSMTGTVVVTEP